MTPAEETKPVDPVPPTDVAPEAAPAEEPIFIPPQPPVPKADTKFKAVIDWAPIEKEYIESEVEPSSAKIAKKFGISDQALYQARKRYGWDIKRDAYWAALHRAADNKLSIQDKDHLELVIKVRSKTLRAADMAIDRYQRMLAGMKVNKVTQVVDPADLKDSSAMFFKASSGMAQMLAALAKCGFTIGDGVTNPDGGENQPLNNPILIAIQAIQQNAPKNVEGLNEPIDINQKD